MNLLIFVLYCFMAVRTVPIFYRIFFVQTKDHDWVQFAVGCYSFAAASDIFWKLHEVEGPTVSNIARSGTLLFLLHVLYLKRKGKLL